jgi:hypothetical protein
MEIVLLAGNCDVGHDCQLLNTGIVKQPSTALTGMHELSKRASD